MTTPSKALVLAAIVCTGVAAIALGFAGPVPQPATEIVQLERVVIVGKRMQSSAEVARLPQVVVTGRRAAPSDLKLAAAKLAKAI